MKDKTKPIDKDLHETKNVFHVVNHDSNQ